MKELDECKLLITSSMRNSFSFQASAGLSFPSEQALQLNLLVILEETPSDLSIGDSELDLK